MAMKFPTVQATSFDPTNLGQYSSQYTMDPDAARTKLAQLQQYKAYLTQNPTAFPNAAVLNQQIDSAIQQQNNVLNYITTNKNATESTNLQGSIGNLQSAYNTALANAEAKKASGIRTQADLENLQYWMGQAGTYKSQLDAAQSASGGLVGKTDVDKAKGDLISGFMLPRQDFEQGRRDLQGYYGTNDPTYQSGQIGAAVQPALRDIYSKRWGTVQAANEGLNQMGLLGGGARKTMKEKVNAVAYKQAQGITADAVGQAEKNIGDYMARGAEEDAKATGLENKIKDSGIGGMFGSSTNQAIGDYMTSSKLANQNALTSAQTDIQRKKQDDDFWNSIADKAGSGAGMALGAFL